MNLPARFRPSARISPGGFFIFDMNTIYVSGCLWQRFPSYNLNEDSADYLELMGTSYDYELNIADVRFIMFEREETLGALRGTPPGERG